MYSTKSLITDRNRSRRAIVDVQNHQKFIWIRTENVNKWKLKKISYFNTNTNLATIAICMMIVCIFFYVDFFRKFFFLFIKNGKKSHLIAHWEIFWSRLLQLKLQEVFLFFFLLESVWLSKIIGKWYIIFFVIKWVMINSHVVVQSFLLD